MGVALFWSAQIMCLAESHIRAFLRIDVFSSHNSFSLRIFKVILFVCELQAILLLPEKCV